MPPGSSQYRRAESHDWTPPPTARVVIEASRPQLPWDAPATACWAKRAHSKQPVAPIESTMFVPSVDNYIAYVAQKAVSVAAECPQRSWRSKTPYRPIPHEIFLPAHS